jgi:hypothetical protein
MYQKDYILRMVEMLGELIGAILKLIKRGEFQKATVAIDEMYYSLLRKDAAFFHNIPIDDLAKNLLAEHNYTHNHLEILAELLYVEAELQSAQKNQPASLLNYKKSLKLFEFIEADNKNYSLDRKARIEAIKIKTKEIDNLHDV